MLSLGLCSGILLSGLVMLSVMVRSFCVCSQRGRGGESSNLWWVGVPLMFFVLLRVASLCGVTSLIRFWDSWVPGELCPGAPFWVEL